MRAIPVLLSIAILALALTPTAAAGQPCTTPPKKPVDAILWAASCQLGGLETDTPVTEVDLRWMTACPGPWGHEERTTVGPVTVVTYVCDDPDA